MSKIFNLIMAMILLVSGCGEDPSSNRTKSKSLKSLTESLIDVLPKCTMPDGQTWYMRSCSDGDAMTVQAYVYSFDPDNAKRFVRESIGDNGRPYRTPKVRQDCESGVEETVKRGGTVSSSCDFSRDHIISILFYTLVSKDAVPLKKVLGYAEDHNFKFCPYSVNQCAFTPSILDAVGDVLAHVGESRPWYTHVPGVAVAAVTKIATETVDGYQMTLCFELALLKAKTGHLNSEWIKMAKTGYDRFKHNLYYAYVYRLVADDLTDKALDSIREKLESMMEIYIEKPVAKAWVWNKTENESVEWLVSKSCGYDMLMLALLLMEGV